MVRKSLKLFDFQEVVNFCPLSVSPGITRFHDFYIMHSDIRLHISKRKP